MAAKQGLELVQTVVMLDVGESTEVGGGIAHGRHPAWARAEGRTKSRC